MRAAQLRARIDTDSAARSCAGIAIIAGQLLQHSPEEDAFWIFISLMDTHLRPYFSSNATQMDVDAFLFQKAVEAADPSVAKKLFVDMAIPAIRICRPWYVTRPAVSVRPPVADFFRCRFSSLFAESLPPDYFLRTWDIFLCEGRHSRASRRGIVRAHVFAPPQASPFSSGSASRS